ncbi:hypothetical protein BDF22DRAFT_672622, partial [Syncephalis plumigaleata]
AVFMLVTFLTIWVCWHHTQIHTTLDASCSVYYPKAFLWIRTFWDLSTNIFFSVTFIRAVVNQYRSIRNSYWLKLKSDGLVCLFARALGEVTEMLFIIDCTFFLVSFLLFNAIINSN